MARIRRHIWCILTALATLAIVGIGRVAGAQDDVVVEEERAAPVDMAVNVPRVELVDQWLFGAQVGGVDVARNQLNSALGVRIDEIERSCGLTEAQKQKLQLAGTADIKRFFDRMDEIKRELKSYNNNKMLNQAIQPLVNELQSGLFGDHSFFAKTIKRTLSAEQAAKLESFIRQQKLSRYRSTVGWYVVQLDRSLGLSDNQRQRLEELLVNATRPPKKYGPGVNWFVLNQASSIPESRIKPIFNHIQWRMFSRQLSHAKRMEEWLKTNGVVPDDEPAGGQPDLAITPAVPSGSTLTIKRAKLEVKPSEEKKE